MGIGKQWSIPNSGKNVNPVYDDRLGNHGLTGFHEFRVLGVSNLRVADGSIMPRPPNTYTAAPIMMIGEKAAAMILEVHHMKS